MTGASPCLPFVRLGPARPVSPLVCAVPHAGRAYPAALLAAARQPEMLEELEDRHADRLIEGAVCDGAVAIVATMARACLDLNRGPEDLAPVLRDGRPDALPVSARARSGLGLIPTRIGGRELWQRLPDPAEVAARVAAIHAPYHAAVAAALADARAEYGVALLLDCHSMPSLRGTRSAAIVVGDRQGRSAASHLGRSLVRAAEQAGFGAALNAPYAGAYTLERHGRPAAGVHAVQIEVDRALYLMPDLRTPGAGLDRVRDLIAHLASTAIASLAPPAIAAE